MPRTATHAPRLADHDGDSLFAPLPAQTRRDQVVDALREAILAGRLAPGTQLVEARLAPQFGIGRGVLREAIRELVENGLAVHRPYAGAHVADVDADTLRDVYEVRRLLEPQAYRRLWPQRDAAFRDALAGHYAAMVEAQARGDLGEAIHAESRFHGLAYVRCGNPLMAASWEQMSRRIRLGFAICQRAPVPKPDFERNHRRFLECALGDDLATMIGEVDRHLAQGLETILAAFPPAAVDGG